MMITFDVGRENLRKLIAAPAVDADSNEASVRFHVVDALVQDVLGWPRPQVHVEVHLEQDYSDYELGTPARLLIEAKRASKVFPVPSGYKSKLVPLTVLCDYSKETRAALEQALEYCKQRGIQFGVISNGNQFIGFLGSRIDGVPASQGYAIVFGSLQEVEERFVQFWECFSFPSNQSGYLEALLKADVLPSPPEKLAKHIANYPGYKNRNPAATELQILGGLFIEDVVKHPEIELEFLRNTYCTSGALSQYALVSREILRARYSSVFEQAGHVSASPASTKRGLNPELYQDIVASSMGKRPILLVGDVGSGKTMFIRHLIKIDAADELEKAFVLYIDFGSKPAVVDALRPYVVDEMSRQLLDSYNIDINENNFVRSVYYVALQRFGRGIYGDLQKTDPAKFKEKELDHLASLIANPEEHLKRALEYATKNQRKPVIVFFDNVDQRPTVFQEQVFLIANAIATDWPVTTFVALRPETFLFSKTRGSLSGYQPRVFTIDPPRADQVLAARLTFARKQLQATGRFAWMPKGFTLNSQVLLGYIQMLEDALKNNPALVEFLDNMSSGNLREALGMVTAFVGSGHVDSNKIITAIKTTGGYTLPAHEFMRAIIYGDHEHFYPANKGVINILDIGSNDCREHFLIAILLKYIETHGQVGNMDGYVYRTAIYRYSQSLGFHPTQVDTALARAADSTWRLIQPGPNEPPENASRYRITTAGAYTYKRLLTLFVYLDAMVVDTPITDPAFRDRILEAKFLDERLLRTGIFLDYLDCCWAALPAEVKDHFDWKVLGTGIREDIRRISQHLPNGSRWQKGVITSVA